MRISAAIIGVVLLASTAWAGSPHHPIGYVKRMSGSVTVQRAGARSTVHVGDPVFVRDSYHTGKNATVGVALLDGTRLTTGANSSFSIDEYEFDEEEDNFAFVTRVWGGTYEFVSGMISKMAAGATQVITPNGTIRPEGTRFVIQIAPGATPPSART